MTKYWKCPGGGYIANASGQMKRCENDPCDGVTVTCCPNALPTTLTLSWTHAVQPGGFDPEPDPGSVDYVWNSGTARWEYAGPPVECVGDFDDVLSFISCVTTTFRIGGDGTPLAPSTPYVEDLPAPTSCDPILIELDSFSGISCETLHFLTITA